MKKFVVSSTTFNTKTKLLRQLQEWEDEGTLDENMIIYELNDKTKTYKVQFKLDLVKNLNK